MCVYVCVHDVGATVFWKARCRAGNKKYFVIFDRVVIWDGKVEFNNKCLYLDVKQLKCMLVKSTQC